MDHPFINASSLTDEDLLKKMNRCHEVAAYALGVGQTTMYESAMLQYETYQDEYQTRIAKHKHEEYLEKSPDGAIEIGEVRDISNLRKPDDES